MYSDSGQIVKTQDGYDFILNEQKYEIQSLYTLLGIARSTPIDHNKPTPLMLINILDDMIAIELDEALNGKNMVVNRFNEYTPKIPGIIGASILGDGSMAAVIDFNDLVNNPISKTEGKQNILENITPIKAKTVLVVDDSISARSSMVRILENSGFETMTALDGFDALLVIEEKTPDILVIDLEMPRMNGLELANRIKADSNLKYIPLVMVTSRTTEKHKKLAKKAKIDAFYTKPFQEDLLISKIYQLLD
jgi:CheY-like chemotaxis protein